MIVVDVETGGLDPRKNPILAIGAVDFDTGATFEAECYPRPDLVIEDQALAVNGFTREYLQNIEMDTRTMLQIFLEWCANLKTDYTIAGENPSFDRDFIAENLKHYLMKNPFGHRTVDLHSIMYARLMSNGLEIPTDGRKNKLNLDVILKWIGLPEEPRPHKAINGARFEYQAFQRLIK